jgi:signal transduction histidine kinase
VVGHVLYVLLRTNYLQKTKLDGFARELQARVLAQTEEIRELAGGISSVQEAERARIARDLHDEMGQKLVGLGMELQWVQRKLEPLGAPAGLAGEGLHRAQTQIGGLHESLRDILGALRPRSLEESGLDAALSRMVREAADKNGFTADVDIGVNVDSLSSAASVVLFRIVQEAVANIGRHARARQVHIQLLPAGQDILLRIADDGVGFDALAVREKGRLGLRGIMERTSLLKGTCRVNSQPGKGCIIEIRFPIDSLGLESAP